MLTTAFKRTMLVQCDVRCTSPSSVTVCARSWL